MSVLLPSNSRGTPCPGVRGARRRGDRGSDLLDAAEQELRAAEDRIESLTIAVDAISTEIAAIEAD